MTPADLYQAHLLAQASDLAYAVGKPGGVAKHPDFDRSVFVGKPHEVSDGKINAAVAVETAEAFVLGFRGTLPLDLSSLDGFVTSALDWMNDAQCAFVDPPYAGGRVHGGFAESLDAVWGGLLPAIRARNPKKPIWITGHSKGGAVATLAAAQKLGSRSPAESRQRAWRDSAAADLPAAHHDARRRADQRLGLIRRATRSWINENSLKRRMTPSFRLSTQGILSKRRSSPSPRPGLVCHGTTAGEQSQATPIQMSAQSSQIGLDRPVDSRMTSNPSDVA